ncbi:MAG: hypothetical protein C0402_16950 [Thermodesulfovibrio sp.]|nr:hypothetical protein [Thermodesulfovibrio sp.]
MPGKKHMSALLTSDSKFWKNRILLRTTVLSWALVIATLGLFVVYTLPYQKKALVERMVSETRNIVTSIDQVTATALITEDYGTVVDHCTRVVKESSSILYVVLTRNDGFSLVHTPKGWEQQQLSGIWLPSSARVAKSDFLKNDLVGKDVFHYSHPFHYSGIDWGWIHIGLSLEKYHAELRNLYIRTLWLAILCITAGLAASLFFARKLSDPIKILDTVTQRVAAGDLTARAEVKTGDELESLGNSFNKMTEALGRSREEFVASQEYTNNIITSMNDMLMVVSPAGVINKVNRAALDLLGYAEGELLGKPIESILTCEGQDQEKSASGESLCELIERGSLRNLETFYISRDGRKIPVLFSGSVMRDSGGNALGMVCMALDLTKRKETEDALKKAKIEEERLKTQKLESIGTLAGGIAHDFNNLLQGVFGYISMAKMTIDQKEKSLSMLDQAEKALNLSVNLTTQLLTFSKGGKPVKKLIRIEPIIKNAAKFALSGSHTDYRLETASDLCPVEADEGQLSQVIQNIVLNANEAMADGGIVRISLANVDIARGMIASLPEGGRFVRIDIRDSGTGIPEQSLSKIFDPYFTTKKKGSGLGLATSYSIIKNHGGLIEVKSEPNTGTTFVIYLPASGSAEMEATAAVAHAAGTKKIRILLMDDEEIVRNVAQEMFAALGHGVVCAEDGSKAIEQFRQATEEGTPFDLVVLDLTVKGGMGGEEAIRRILEIDPHVKAVVSSGYADNPVVADFRAYGFSAVLSKPYRLDTITNCLGSIGLS